MLPDIRSASVSVQGAQMDVACEDKVEPVHAVKAYSGSRGIAPLILNLGPRWRTMINVTPRPLYPLERTPLPIP